MDVTKTELFDHHNPRWLTLPADLARLLSDVDFELGCVVEASRKPGSERLRKARVQGARRWLPGQCGIYLPIAVSGEPIKVGFGSHGRFSESWLVVETRYPRAATIGASIFEAEMPDKDTGLRTEVELRERLLRAGYKLPYNRERGPH